MVKICVIGCLHGELTKMYKDVQKISQTSKKEIELVLVCGDFQTVRNESDLTVMSVPVKYRRLGDFWRYYNGELKAPYMTILIGGNHEASNYLQELPYGGWVAPNIYYLGYASVINFRGLRIAGMSGIYKRHDYYSGHYEHAPYDDQSQRTAYHVRNIETFRMTQIKLPIDIVLSHDWPRGIYNYSNQLPQLLKHKPHFADEIRDNVFGSPAGEEILMHLQPRYWFAAHHHCKFTASVQFDDVGEKVTHFLALDKCLPRKHYLQFLDILPNVDLHNEDNNLYLDPEWLCILKATNHLMSVTKSANIMPTTTNNEKCNFSASKEDIKELSDLFKSQFKIPDNFETTAPVHNEEYFEASKTPKPVEIFANPQTDLICAMLDLVNPNQTFLGSNLSLDDLRKKLRKTSSSSSDNVEDSSDCGESDNDENKVKINKEIIPNEINLGEVPQYEPCVTEENPEEINIDDDDDEEDMHEYDPKDSSEYNTKEDENEYNPKEDENYFDNIKDKHECDLKEIDENEVEVKEEEGLQYDPTDYPDNTTNDGYCPTAPFL